VPEQVQGTAATLLKAFRDMISVRFGVEKKCIYLAFSGLRGLDRPLYCGTLGQFKVV
jgi:hypothetical protein